MKRLYIFLGLVLHLGIGYTQNTIGLPDVFNYNKDKYSAGTQNWEIEQDENGVIYFANNEGLLCFDGKHWKNYPLPNKTIVRSVHLASNQKLYVGGQDEMGFFTPGNNGLLEYHSLIEKLAVSDRNFGDVWDIVSINDEVFFRTTTRIFKLNNDLFTVYKANSEWMFLGKANNTLYAQDNETGILYYSSNNWYPLEQNNTLVKNNPVTDVLVLNNRMVYFTTLKNGIFQLIDNQLKKLITPALSLIENNRIYAAKSINKEIMALGTSNNGIYIVDKAGKLIQHFSKKEGLQNNNILSLKTDSQGNIWAGLDNGIDCIAYDNPIKKILPNDQNGSGYAAVIHNNELYLGTSSGVYHTELQNRKDLSFSMGNFSPVMNTNGQVWNLSEINGKLLLGHHEGSFIINNYVAQPLLNATGFWNYMPLSNVFPASSVIAGNYKGIQYFNFQNSTFSPSFTIPEFNETSRYIAVDKNENIWVSHPYHGIYKITKNANGQFRSELFDEKKGLPFTINNHIYKIKNQVVAATEKGIYEYNQATNQFQPNKFYTELLGSQSIRYIKEDKDGNLWFIHEKSLGVIDFTAQKPQVILLENLHKKMLSGFEFIYPIDQRNIILGAEEGFFHINYEKYKKNTTPPVVRISSVKIINQKDSTIFGGYYQYINSPEKQVEKAIPEINDDWKDIHFEFAVPGMSNDADIQYCYRLKGIENKWSEWSGKTEKDYTNLSPGDYTFEVKVKNNFGKESSVSQFKFTILPPFYRSPIAFIFYLLLFCAGIFLIYRKQKQKFKLQQFRYEEEQKRLQYLHQLEIDNAESELITLRNEKLQSEIDFKNSELATNAMHLVQKGEILSKIKTELNHIIKSIDNEKTIAELKKMIKALGEDEKMDDDWDHFTQHFDKVHSDFVVVLKEVHPNITANEIKICTYLRMNLSTKEIAQLMNISVRGVEISRYRLRKKLGISTETNLFDYLISLTVKNN